MVYFPSDDSFLLMEEMEKIIKESKPRNILDVGTGCGILAERAREITDSLVIASDIDREAVKKAKKLGLNVVIADTLSAFKKIDLILFNPPYLPGEFDDVQGGKGGCEVILKFLKELPRCLDGVCLLILSSLTNFEKVKKELTKLNLKYKVVRKKRIFFEELFVLKILR